MSHKEEVTGRWADLTRRFNSDTDLSTVVESLDRALEVEHREEPRRRLKVPYANARSLDNGTEWS